MVAGVETDEISGSGAVSDPGTFSGGRPSIHISFKKGKNMANYQDKNGFSWPIRFTVSSLKKIREQVRTKDGHPFDLLNIADSSTIPSLFQDPILLVDILWTLNQEYAAANKKTREEFESLHTGDTLFEAGTAIVEGLADFFPNLEGTALRKAVDAMREERAQMLEQLKNETFPLENGSGN